MHTLASGDSLISQAFARLTPPTAPHDPNGPYHHRYHDLTSHHLKWVMGSLRIERQPEDRLRIEHHRLGNNDFKFWTITDSHCKRDALSTPRSWTVETKVSREPEDPAYLLSGLKKHAQVVDEKLELTIQKHSHTHFLPGPYTCKWALLDAVGRMAISELQEIHFTLLDEADAICPDQKVWRCGTVEAHTRSGPVQVTCYRHTGIATMPGMFYVDHQGRVLFYLAGMELLALDQANGVSTDFFSDNKSD